MVKLLLSFLLALSLFGQVTNYPVQGSGTSSSSVPPVLRGTGAPGPTVGVSGQYYIDSATGDMYGPKVSNSWPSTPFLNLKGPIGPTGPQGTPGNITGAPSIVVTGSTSNAPGYIKIFDGSGNNFYMLASPASLSTSYCRIPPVDPPLAIGVVEQVSSIITGGICPDGTTGTVVQMAWVSGSGGGSGSFTYYIDPLNGNDSNDGSSISLAFATQTPANALTLTGTQTIGFYTGASWVLYRKLGMQTNETVLTTAIITAQTNTF